MTALTREALSRVAPGRRRGIGRRWRFPARCSAVGSRAAPVADYSGARTLIHTILGTERRAGSGVVSMRSRVARRVAIMEQTGTPLCDCIESYWQGGRG